MDLQTVLTNFINTFAADVASVENNTGDITKLNTREKATLVNAINQLYLDIVKVPTTFIDNTQESTSTVYSSSYILYLIKTLEENIVGDLVNTSINVFDNNLIQNGDAEAIVGSASGGGNIYTPTKWNCTGSVITVLYNNNVSGMLNASSSGPTDRGNNFFAGGDSLADSSMSQVINVTKGFKDIDASTVTYKLSGYLGGKGSKNDSPIITMDLVDYFGNTSSVKLGPVTSVDRNYTTGLLYKEITGSIPKGTRSIRITVVFKRYSGTYNDAYLDNLSLVLTGGTNQTSTIGVINFTELSLKALGDKMTAIRAAIAGINADTKFSCLPQTLSDTEQRTTRVNIGLESNDLSNLNILAIYDAYKPTDTTQSPYLVISRFSGGAYIISILNADSGVFTDITDLCGNALQYSDNDDPTYMQIKLYSDTIRYVSMDYASSIITSYDDTLSAFSPVMQDKLFTALDPTASRTRNFVDKPSITLYKGKYYYSSVYTDNTSYYMNLITFDQSNQSDPVIAQSQTVPNVNYDVDAFMAASPAFVSLVSRFIIYKDQIILMGGVGFPYGSVMPELSTAKTVFRTPPNKTDVENTSAWHTVTYDGVFFASGKELGEYLFLEGMYYDRNNGNVVTGGLYRASQYVPGSSITIEKCIATDLNSYSVTLSGMLFDGSRYIHPDFNGSSDSGIYAWVSTDGLNFTRELIVDPTKVTLLPVIPGSPGTGGGKGGSTLPTPDIIRTVFRFMTYRNGKYIINLQFGIFSSSEYNTGWSLIPNCYNDAIDLTDGAFAMLINSYSK